MDGRQIRAAREARGWTQEQLAQRLGVGQRTVGGWERGETVPKNRMGMLDELLGATGPETDPIRTMSEVRLLSELLRRAAEREQRAAAG